MPARFSSVILLGYPFRWNLSLAKTLQDREGAKLVPSATWLGLEADSARLPGNESSWYATVMGRGSNQTTFASRVLEHVDALHAFAYRLTRNSSETEDLVQDTFTRAISAEAQFRLGSNLRAWLFRILRNRHIDGVRRARNLPLSTEQAEESAASADVEAELLRGDIELDRLRRVVAGDIEAALFELSEDARSVVLLDFEGLSEAEIAEVMECAPGTVKSRLARARASLRIKLAEYAK